ncbi:MAG: ClpXP protease specificity-enhancing factor SspB [Hyphomicrobiaceae bacterium]
MTSGQHIDYDALALEALRGVVKACLAQVARTGLVGDHHFYIAFNTQAPGVGMSKRLKEKYPVEMTIVLQHRFWDLAVDDDRFEVKLTFDGIPERLVIPFAAVKVFYDPSVPYVLQFEEIEAAQGAPSRKGPRRSEGQTDGFRIAKPGEAIAGPPEEGGEKADRRRPARRTRGSQASEDGSENSKSVREPPVAEDGQPADQTPGMPGKPAAPPAVKPVAVQGATATAAAGNRDGDGREEEPDEGPPSDTGGAKIVDLAKFRSKK